MQKEVKIQPAIEFQLESFFPCPEIPPSSFNFQYCLVTQLGRGGFGVVYEGVRRIDGEKVAVKYVWKERVRRWGEVN